MFAGIDFAVREETRYDRAEIKPGWEETPEGYLRIPATFSRAGLQRYRRADGSTAVEYRPEEEVSRKDALLSLANLPVTLEHPPELLTPETCTQYQRGFSGSHVEYRSPFATGFVTITDRDAIDAVKRGDAREVSVGYRVKFDATPGVSPDGERYDGVQREISGNHIAIVRKGRAGPEVRLHMDSACAVDPYRDDGPSDTTQTEEEHMTAVAALSNATEALANALSAQVRADAKGRKSMPVMEEEESREGADDPDMEREGEMEMDPEEEMDGGAANLGSYKVAKKDAGCGGGMKRRDSDDLVPRSLLDEAIRERDEAIAAHERDLGRLDALIERIDSMEDEIDSRLDSEIDLNALVQQRLELIDQLEAVTGERPTMDSLGGLSDRELMVDALVQAGVDAERLEGRSDDYVAATFDLYANARQDRADRLDSDPLVAALSGIPMETGDHSAARQRMIQAQQSASQQPLTITKKGAA